MNDYVHMDDYCGTIDLLVSRNNINGNFTVQSNDIIAQGKSLDEAIDFVVEKLKKDLPVQKKVQEIYMIP